ncbi:MAG TPA: polysaccharide lyase family 7 protein [Telluria sp.]|nr:polysaccharide lyase family 7 protein [Telluria sp.]
MNLIQRTCGLSLLCTGLLAASSHAQPGAGAATGFTSKEALSSLFDLEGNSPFPSPYAGTLNFSALSSKFATANGHGYRNELKMAAKNRLPIEQTHEHFSALVTPTLPNGYKTIVAQYHVDGLETILKVYVQDTAESSLLDGKANNGVFDVVAKLGMSGTEGVETALGTIRSGDTFALDIKFENGDATVTVKTDKNGTIQTKRTHIVADKRKIFFKFGDYSQAQDPDTKALTIIPSKWDEYFRLHHIDKDLISFSHTTFVRD